MRVPGCDEPFAIGGLVQPKLHLVGLDGEPVDGTVSASVKLPSGVVEVPVVVHDALGEFHFDYVPAIAGQFFFTFIATGGPSVSASGAFLVAAAVV